MDGGLSLDVVWSAIRFKMKVAVRGLIMRWFDADTAAAADDRVVRPLTAFAICSNGFFELFDSSIRRRKSTTWAFNSFICMEQFRSFCACRFWIPITLFNYFRKYNKKILLRWIWMWPHSFGLRLFLIFTFRIAALNFRSIRI